MRKNLKPSAVGTKKGTHRSTCMSSKADKETFIVEGNDNLFCLEKWQMSQQCDLFTCTSGTSLFNKIIWHGKDALNESATIEKHYKKLEFVKN